MQITNEGLAAILRAMVATGVVMSRDEKEYILEAADRLEYMEGDDNG